MADLAIVSQRGGCNNTDPASSLPLDQCTHAENVEFYLSMLGERRRGSTAVDLTASGLTSHEMVPLLHRHLPSSDETEAELWAIGVSTDSDSYTVSYKDTAWHEVTPVDAIDVSGTYAFSIQALSFHGKLFVAHKSAVDRLHVWDGTTLRRSGLAEPGAAPTGANAGSGTFAGTRYYRTREVVVDGSTVILRSEPSATLTAAPSGTGASYTVTKPATTNSNATHWEIEASLNNGDFYRMDRIAIGTTTHSDSVAFNTGYAVTGTLSEDIGDYTPIPSVRYLAADGDRLLGGGSYEDASLASDVVWTTVTNEPGVGNDERIPVDTDNRLPLDGRDGGDLTGLSGAVVGSVFATKLSAIYQLTRSGQRSKAYDAFALSRSRGALHGSLVEGVDQAGNACLYALDPRVGPIRIGTGGVRTAGKDIQTTWQTVNLDATQAICRGVFYPEKQQVHWWIAVDGANAPSMRIMLQVNESRTTDDGVRKGWALHTLPVDTQVYAACMFAENIDDNAARSLTLRPFIGTNVAGALVQRCDTGDQDNGVDYAAQIVSRPIAAAGLLSQFGVMSAAVLAKAAVGVELRVSASRDYGAESLTPIDVPLDPDGSETDVIKPIDTFSFNELRTVQVEFTDVDAPAGVWEINGFAMRTTKGQGV